MPYIPYGLMQSPTQLYTEPRSHRIYKYRNKGLTTLTTGFS